MPITPEQFAGLCRTAKSIAVIIHDISRKDIKNFQDLLREVIPQIKDNNIKAFQANIRDIISKFDYPQKKDEKDSQGQKISDIIIENIAITGWENLVLLIKYHNCRKYNHQFVQERARSASFNSWPAAVSSPRSSDNQVSEELPNYLVRTYAQQHSQDQHFALSLAELLKASARLDIDNEEIFAKLAPNLSVMQALLLYSVQEGNCDFFNFCLVAIDKFKEYEQAAPLKLFIKGIFQELLNKQKLSKSSDRNGDDIVSFLIAQDQQNQDSFASELFAIFKSEANLAKFDYGLLARPQANFFHRLVATNKFGLFAEIAKKIAVLPENKREEILQKRDKNGNTVLHIACANGWDNPIATLVELGADIDSYNDREETPLIIAVKKDYRNTCKELCELGADLSKGNAKETPLIIAAQRNSESILEILLKNKANPNLGPINDRLQMQFPLQFAVENGNIKAAKLLIEYGAAPSLVEGYKGFFEGKIDGTELEQEFELARRIGLVRVAKPDVGLGDEIREIRSKYAQEKAKISAIADGVRGQLSEDAEQESQDLIGKIACAGTIEKAREIARNAGVSLPRGSVASASVNGANFAALSRGSFGQQP